MALCAVKKGDLMISSKKLVLLSALLAAFALPGCGKKCDSKKPKAKIERQDKRIKRAKKSKKARSVKRSRRSKKAKKSKKVEDRSKKSLLNRSY